MERNRVAEASKGMGKPKVGGKFELLDYSGKKFGDEDMKGGFTLVSFFFQGLLRLVFLRDRKRNELDISKWFSGKAKSSILTIEKKREKCAKSSIAPAKQKPRSTSVSPTAPTSAPKNSTKWPA